jgi:DNA-binding Lrp family transcriptional regulator
MDTLDKTDLQILRTLQENARLTTKELAARVSLSSTPVFERLKRLESGGYIKKYIAVLDAEKLNQEILAFTESAYYYIQNYSINPNLNIKDFEAELKKEYDFRLERRNEYLTKYKPMEDVTLFTEELLK